MSAYPPKDLDLLWRQNRLTAEQAVGHLVQLVLELQQRQAELEKRLRQLEQRRSSCTQASSEGFPGKRAVLPVILKESDLV